MTKYHVGKHLGTTFFEMLLVLSIVAVCFSFSFLQVSRWKGRLENQFFLFEFEKVLYQLQQTALFTNQTTKISLNQQLQKIEYETVDYNGNIVTINLKIPSKLIVQATQTIQFKKGNGNTGKMKKVSFICLNAKKKYSYQFQMGSGRFEKKEESNSKKSWKFDY